MSEAGGAKFEDLNELARVVASGEDVDKMLRTATLVEYLQEWEIYQILLTAALQVQRQKATQDKALEAGILMRLAKSWLELDRSHPSAFSFAKEALEAWKEVGDPEQVAAATILYASTPKGDSAGLLREAMEALKAMPTVPEAMLATVLLRLGVTDLEVKKWDGAQKTLQEALELADRAFGHQHHERAEILLQLGRVLLARAVGGATSSTMAWTRPRPIARRPW